MMPGGRNDRIIEKYQFCTVNDLTAVEFIFRGCFVIIYIKEVSFKSLFNAAAAWDHELVEWGAGPC